MVPLFFLLHFLLISVEVTFAPKQQRNGARGHSREEQQFDRRSKRSQSIYLGFFPIFLGFLNEFRSQFPEIATL